MLYVFQSTVPMRYFTNDTNKFTYLFTALYFHFIATFCEDFPQKRFIPKRCLGKRDKTLGLIRACICSRVLIMMTTMTTTIIRIIIIIISLRSVPKDLILLFHKTVEKPFVYLSAFHSPFNALRAIQNIRHTFWTKFNPLPSVTNCHIWLTPLSMICHKPQLSRDSMHLTDFCTRISITIHIFLFMFVFMYSCMNVNQY